MTLQEKIDSAKQLVEQIRKEHPEISNIWFDFENVPTDEIEEFKNVENAVDIVNRQGKDILRYCLSDPHITIFATSKPIKIIQPSYVIEQ